MTKALVYSVEVEGKQQDKQLLEEEQKAAMMQAVVTQAMVTQAEEEDVEEEDAKEKDAGEEGENAQE
jgi:uncharacterized protein YeaC (DUF1315 family)